MRSHAFRQIEAAVDGLVKYAHRTAQLTLDKAEATVAICGFLSHFDVSCLRAFLRNTAIPDVSGHQDVHATLVSKYVMHIKEEAVDRFQQFMVMVQGHMLANALLCPDLAEPTTYSGVTFYLDTPLLIHGLGLEGREKKEAVDELVRLLRHLKGRIATFSHLRDELVGVLRGAADYLDNVQHGRGGIVVEARRRGTTRSDLLLLAGDIDVRLSNLGVEIRRTPEYATKFQIDEREFEAILREAVLYDNDRARASDVNSVRSIYALRGGTAARSIERSKAILVTSNAAFARSAWQYGQNDEVARDVSSVITDFSLANVAWLKAPMGASSLPVAEVMAYCYAAVQPSTKLIDKFLKEIDKLCASGEVTERQHRLLRSSPSTYTELVDLTLGDESALTHESILEALERVTEEIVGEQSEALSSERMAHEETRRRLDVADSALHRLRDKMYWRCVRRARLATAVALGLAGTVVGFGGLVQSAAVGHWVGDTLGTETTRIASYLHWAVSAMSLVGGCSLMTCFRWLYPMVLRRLVARTLPIDDPDVPPRSNGLGDRLPLDGGAPGGDDAH